MNPAVTLLISRPQDWSFPSGHAAASFAAVGGALLSEKRGRLLGPVLILAALIAFSRLYLYVALAQRCAGRRGAGAGAGSDRRAFDAVGR